MIEGLHHLFALLFAEGGFFCGIVEQTAIFSFQFFATSPLLMGTKALVHHILHDFTGRIERACLLAG